MSVDINLTVEELNAILSMLGELPTKTGAFPLIMKMKEQAESSLKAQQVSEVPKSPRTIGNKNG
jgi:hypothetical protein